MKNNWVQEKRFWVISQQKAEYCYSL